MANQLIRPSNLPPRANPVSTEVVPSDDGSTVAGVTWANGVAAGRPLASQGEAEAGSDAAKAMTPLTTKQAIDAQVPGKISAELANYTPTSGLGTAAFDDTGDFATAAQGGLADTAVQPGDLGALASENTVTSSLLDPDVFSSNHTWSGVQTFSATPVTVADPTTDNELTRKKYVDDAISGSIAGVASLNGQTGALAFVSPPQGRLTLESGVPVMATTQSAKTTLYYTPYVGNQLPIHDGTNMIPTAFAEISVETTDTAKNPAAIGANKVNDWFVWNDGGTIRLSHGPDWTNDTTRSAGTALTRVNGVLLNAVAITNGPGAERGTYVGTTRSDGSGQLNWILGSAANGGGMAVLNVWNAYNRVDVTTSVVDTIGSWTYTSSTARASENSTSNRVWFVSGLAEDGVYAAFSQRIATATVYGAFGRIGIGLDSTSSYEFHALAVSPASGVIYNAPLIVQGAVSPQLGTHYLQALESGDGSNSTTFLGGAQTYQFSARLRM